MLRISVVNEPTQRWSPVIGRCFRMTLAPLQDILASLSVQLRAPPDGTFCGTYACELRGRTSAGTELVVRSAHENGELAVTHAFARARRELRRERLRAPLAG